MNLTHLILFGFFPGAGGVEAGTRIVCLYYPPAFEMIHPPNETLPMPDCE